MRHNNALVFASSLDPLVSAKGTDGSKLNILVKQISFECSFVGSMQSSFRIDSEFSIRLNEPELIWLSVEMIFKHSMYSNL